MEQQFILRLPDVLLDIDPKDCSLTRVNQQEVCFAVKGKSYRGVVCKIPSIVESQKIVENKLYKIADISTLIVIYENNDFVIEDEIAKHESSGLTPPMVNVKEKRFEKNSVRSEEVEKIEAKVNDLLLEDSKAIKVEIISNDKESTEMDLDMLAAEIENEFRPEPVARPDFISINTKTKEPSSTAKSIPTEVPKSMEFDDISDVDESIPPKNFDIAYVKEQNDKKVDVVIDTPVVVVQKTTPELVNLENRIKEKKEQYEKAANPILKKRFEVVLNALTEEYNKLLNELNNK